MKTIRIYQAYFIVAALILSTSCKHNPVNETKGESNLVRTTKIERQKIMLPVQLSFKTGGVISDIYVDEGQKVNKGDLLAVLNLAEIQAMAQQADNGYQKSLRDFQRAKDLYADSVITLELMQNAETAMNVARASLEIAMFNLNHSRITAPDNGVILQRLAEKDEVIGPGYPVIVFGTTGKFWKIKAGLTDRDFVKVQIGDSCIAKADAYPDNTFRANISLIGESANPYTGTYEVEMDMEPSALRLAPGFIVNVEIYPTVKDEYFIIPVESLIEANGKTGIIFMLDEEQRARKINVTIAGFIGNHVAVKGELKNYTEVVTGGSAYLSEGDTVTIVK